MLRTSRGAQLRIGDRSLDMAWADKVQQLLLSSNGEASEEVVLDAPRGVVITKEGRGRRRRYVQRLAQGDR